MTCSTNTMIKLAAGIGLTLTVAYFALPESQAFVLASAPILLVLICPLAMVIMMASMRGKGAQAKDERKTPEEPPVAGVLSDVRPQRP